MFRLISAWAAALGVVAMVSSGAPAGGALQQPDPDRRVVHVSAERFVFTPSEITVTVGEEVEIRLTSDDTGHGFRLVGTDTDLAIPKRGGGDVRFVFRATTAGRVTFECSRLCGAGHNFMRGVIVVTEPTR